MVMALAILVPVISAAQEIVDSVKTQELKEIVVKAPKVIRRTDMDVYYPSQNAVENSRNGMQLLSN
ncbi:MAG: hypothetical protein K2M12_09015, partial [Muribaculaceae bacterium]|nr:hypothetical protein [Muribaculaceae bacterium]